MAAAAVIVAVAIAFVLQAQTPARAAAACSERFIGAPIAESGIECPGTPTVWKSHTFISLGTGYYTETERQAGGMSQVRMGYRHHDGRVAISVTNCGANGCEETHWNGVPFPFTKAQ